MGTRDMIIYIVVLTLGESSPRHFTTRAEMRDHRVSIVTIHLHGITCIYTCGVTSVDNYNVGPMTHHNIIIILSLKYRVYPPFVVWGGTDGGGGNPVVRAMIKTKTGYPYRRTKLLRIARLRKCNENAG